MSRDLPFLRVGVVQRVLERTGNTSKLVVETEGRQAPAINYDALTGEVAAGQTVLLNVSATALGLGTGGLHLVVANLGRPESDFQALGRGMKLRYSPLQRPVQLVEEAFPEALSTVDGLNGLPVVLAPLHSLAVACIVALHWLRTNVCVAFIINDSSGLMAGFSDALGRLQQRQMVASITVGQAFGGDIEAVNVHSGLLAAKTLLGADVAVVGSTPGHLGTATRYGFSSLSLAEAANAASLLGATPLLIPRVSFADARERHLGLSHHTLTILSFCLRPVVLPFPLLSAEQSIAVSARWRQADARHRQVFRDGTFIAEALRDFGGLQSMGRDYAHDPAFFQAAGAAASLSLELADGNPFEPKAVSGN